MLRLEKIKKKSTKKRKKKKKRKKMKKGREKNIKSLIFNNLFSTNHFHCAQRPI